MNHSPTTAENGRCGRVDVVLVRVLLAVHTLLLVWLAWNHSPADAEGEYLPAGICHWQLGRLEPACRNPPLPRLLAALPVAFLVKKHPWEVLSGAGNDAEIVLNVETFSKQYADRMRIIYFLGRLACIPLSVVAGIICYLWAKQWFGTTGGLLTLTLWCFSPNILANNFLIMPDGPATCLGVCASYCFLHWVREGRLFMAFMSGVTLGAALLAKATWIPLLFAWPILWLVARRWCSPRPLGELASQTLHLLLLLATALGLINMMYGFDGTLMPLKEYRFSSRALQAIESFVHSDVQGGNRLLPTLIGRLPVPFPKLYVSGIDIQRRNAERKGSCFLFGQTSEQGWWYYYFAAALVKVPPSTLLLIAASLLVAVSRPPWRRAWREELLLWAPALLMLALLIEHSTISRHFRYAEPLAPFAFISIARLAVRPIQSFRWWPYVLGGLITWTITSSLFVYPHCLGYFSEIIGGPMHGRHYLRGSNLDRGQDAYFLERWIKTQPSAAEIRVDKGQPLFLLLPPDQLLLRKGLYAVRIEGKDDLERHLVNWNSFQPIARVGYTYLIYNVPNDILMRVPERP